MTFDHRCPTCGKDDGLPRRASTVSGRTDIVNILMVCGSCSHEWTTDGKSLGTNQNTPAEVAHRFAVFQHRRRRRV